MKILISQIPDYIRFVWQLVSGFRYQHEQEIANLRLKDTYSMMCGKHQLNILDLANGQLRPQISILKSNNHRVYGIDLANNPKLIRKEFGYIGARWLFNKQIKITKKQLSEILLVCGDVEKIPFENETFDLVTSVAAFEHFLDLPTVLYDVYRVLRKGGITWVLIHPFSSLSGGHNVKLMEIPLETIPQDIDPWDHLRKRRLPFHVPLNEWRIHQYLEEFSHHFEIINHYCAMREGEHLLTPNIETELSDYSRDELTCLAYVIVAWKK